MSIDHFLSLWGKMWQNIIIVANRKELTHISTTFRNCAPWGGIWTWSCHPQAVWSLPSRQGRRNCGCHYQRRLPIIAAMTIDHHWRICLLNLRSSVAFDVKVIYPLWVSWANSWCFPIWPRVQFIAVVGNAVGVGFNTLAFLFPVSVSY